jgi:hypothetical protein
VTLCQGTAYIISRLFLYFTMSGSALGPNGKLKDSSEITWYDDADDVHPIPAGGEVHLVI